MRWHRMDPNNNEPAAAEVAGAVPTELADDAVAATAAPTRVSAFTAQGSVPVFGAADVGDGEAISADPTEPGSSVTPQPGFPDAVANTPESASSFADDPLNAPLPPSVAEAVESAVENVVVPPAPAAVAPHARMDFNAVEVPHIDVASHFGERIESMIAAATIEAENTRADAQAQAKQIFDDAAADADRLVAAAQRRAADIVATAQQRAAEQLALAEADRKKAQTELDAAHRDAEEIRARAHEHADRVRAEGDAHVKDIIARAHAETHDQLHEARQELVDLSERKVELEQQMEAIRHILEETTLHTTEIPLVPFDGSYITSDGR